MGKMVNFMLCVFYHNKIISVNLLAKGPLMRRDGTNLRTGPRRPCWVTALHSGSGKGRGVLMAGTPSHQGVSTAHVQSQTQDARHKIHVSQSGTGTQARERATAKGSHGRARRRDLRISTHQE